MHQYFFLKRQRLVLILLVFFLYHNIYLKSRGSGSFMAQMLY